MKAIALKKLQCGQPVEEDKDSGGISLWQDAWHRLIQNKMAMFGAAFLFFTACAPARLHCRSYPLIGIRHFRKTRSTIVDDQSVAQQPLQVLGFHLFGHSNAPTDPFRSHAKTTPSVPSNVQGNRFQLRVLEVGVAIV